MEGVSALKGLYFRQSARSEGQKAEIVTSITRYPEENIVRFISSGASQKQILKRHLIEPKEREHDHEISKQINGLVNEKGTE